MTDSRAARLRQKIIDVCARNGGHLGASLGTVELTLALHDAFTTPSDAIVWDVGHQSYAHKILTGRGEEFENLRKRAGPSGFTSREESPHDVFGAGHSSTSISAALGIAEAKRLQGDTSWTVAVIGDGALTSGLAFEALNQAGTSAEPNLVIVVNDNNLSISSNVGALDRWGFGTEREPRKFFEALGFAYSGPIDGHDLDEMSRAFAEIKQKNSGRVAVMHVLTKKGKGFVPAESEPVKFHGVGPFDKLTGRAKTEAGSSSFSQVFGENLLRLATAEPRLIAITAAMAEGTGLMSFSRELPERFYDVGIAEPHSLVFAAGLSTQGLLPVVAIYSTFLQRAVDSVIHDVALQNLPVILAIDRAGLVGPDGPSHHGLFDVSILRAIPNTTLAAPSCAQDLATLLSEAVYKPGLKAIRYPRGVAPVSEEYRNPGWAKARVVKDAESPKPVVVWALGQALSWALEAHELLTDSQKLRVTIVDARFVKPIDSELLGQTLRGAAALLTIEDACLAGGFGSALVEAALENSIGLPAVVKRLGIGDAWVRHAEVSEQRHELGLSTAALVRAIAGALES